MARKYRYDTSAAALLTPAKGAVFFENWDRDVDTANHDLLCAEMSRLAYAENSVVEAALQSIGFSSIAFAGDNNRGTQGFAAKNAAQRVTVLAFRGTESNRFEDVVSDVDTLQRDYRRGGRLCRVHGGFLKAYEQQPVQDLIAAVRRQGVGGLLVTGHSLGAALATLAAVDTMPARLVTFGSPRVGDEVFRALFAGLEVRRFVDCCDVVSRVPPERFDAAHLARLLEELGAPGSSLIGRALGWLKLNAEFAHVSTARYIDRHGLVTEAPGDAQQAADQEIARKEHPHSPRNARDELVALWSSLLTSSAGLPSVPDLRQVTRKLLGGLFNLVRGDPVPLRDLADHAPINYLSGITGRA